MKRKTAGVDPEERERIQREARAEELHTVYANMYQDELQEVIDTGAFTGIILDYLTVAMSEAGADPETIRTSRAKLEDIAAGWTAADVRAAALKLELAEAERGNE